MVPEWDEGALWLDSDVADMTDGVEAVFEVSRAVSEVVASVSTVASVSLGTSFAPSRPPID